MSPLKRSSNISSRMGRWSARHRKTAIFGWLAFVVAAVVIGGALGTKQLGNNDTLPGESGRATKILDEGFKQPAGETVLVQSRSSTADDPAFRAAVADVVRRLSAVSVVTNIRGPYAVGNPGQISADGHSAVVNLDVRGDADTAVDRIDPVLKAVDASAAAHPSLRIEEFGASADKPLDEKFDEDFERAGLLSLPVTIGILLIAFGALVRRASRCCWRCRRSWRRWACWRSRARCGRWTRTSARSMLLIGLAVGVDYTMFYLKREREERAAGKSESAALEAAAATSGRSVLISGLTVMTAMAGMFLTGDKGSASFAMATILVVAIAMLGSLTVLPALLSWLGDRVNKARVPFLHRLQRPEGGRAWGCDPRPRARTPAGLGHRRDGRLIALALPALGMKTVVPGAEALPQDLPAVQTYNRLQQAFPGGQDPARSSSRRRRSRRLKVAPRSPSSRRRRSPADAPPADRRRREQGGDGRPIDLPIDGDRHGREVKRRPGLAPRRHRSGHARHRRRHRGGRHGHVGDLQGLQQRDALDRAARVRLRARVRVRAAAPLRSGRSSSPSTRSCSTCCPSARRTAILVLVFQHGWARRSWASTTPAA